MDLMSANLERLPTVSAILNLMTLIYHLNTTTSNLNFQSSKFAAILTYKVFFAPKNTYQGRDGSPFKSSLEGSTIDSLIGGFFWFFRTILCFNGLVLETSSPSRVSKTYNNKGSSMQIISLTLVIAHSITSTIKPHECQ